MLNLLTMLAAAAFCRVGGAEPFRFHLFTEFQSVDPQVSISANGNYIFHLVHRGLYAYHGRLGLRTAGARSCSRAPLRLTCKLAPSHRWSDGTPVRAPEYVAAFRRLIDPKTASPHADMIFSLKNARAVSAGKLAPANLGVSAPDDKTLVFRFSEEDPEFEYKLIHPATSPLPPGGFRERAASSEMPASGPYRITQWKSGVSLRFEPNLHFPGAKRRPAVEAFFIEEDSTALRMYESGKLDFLRRLTGPEVARYRDRPDFHQIPQARFDYIGFGPDLADHAKLRAALVTGADFSAFRQLFPVLTPPGCPSLPPEYTDRPVCRSFSPEAAKALLAEDPAVPDKLEFYFSRMGGDDIARAAEWFQAQWRKHLGLKIELMPQEQSVYLGKLRTRAPAIFRKGVSLDRPTCLAGLEIFTSGHPENYIRLNDPDFEALVKKLKRARGKAARARACRDGLQHLFQTNRLLPLGQFPFTILVKPRFKGWDLNELNQLDLSELEDTELKSVSH